MLSQVVSAGYGNYLEQEKSELALAAEASDVKRITEAIRAGANPDGEPGEDNVTPLMRAVEDAAEFGGPDAASRHSSASARTCELVLVLQARAVRALLVLLVLLVLLRSLTLRAQVDLPTPPHGISVLQHCAKTGKRQEMELLPSLSADPNIRHAYGGLTALMLAANQVTESGVEGSPAQGQMVAMLLKAGADSTLRATGFFSGRTALNLAKDAEVKELLTAAAAKQTDERRPEL